MELQERPGKFGDCKLLVQSQNYIQLFTTTEGELKIRPFLSALPLESAMPVIKANWLAVQRGRQPGNSLVLVASQSDRRMRLYEINADKTAHELAIITEDDGKLRIDPTLLQVNGKYYATVTEINGAVNNSYPGANGMYTVRLYTSEDLTYWTKRAVIVKAQFNIEDGSTICDNDTGFLYYIFEREILDRGPSSICITRSKDKGNTWSEPVALIHDNSDNEPAAVAINNGILTVLFSSDCENPGLSYDGGKAFIASFDLKSCQLLSRSVLSDAGDSLLLLNTAYVGDRLALVGIRSYSHEPKLAEIVIVRNQTQ